VVYGMGRFFMTNFIAREYYDALYAEGFDAALVLYRNTPMYEQILAGRDMAVRMMANPFVLILGGVSGLVMKGGFLGIILCAFLKKNPDIFAAARNAAPEHDDETEDR
jgi:hypothetical protein